MELGLESVGADLLLLGEDGQRKGEDGKGDEGDEAEVERGGDDLDETGAGLDPFLLHQVAVPGLLHLNVVEDHGGDDHDGTTGEDSADGGFVDGEFGGNFALSERGDIPLRLSFRRQLQLVILGEHRSDIDTLLRLIPSHQARIQETRRRDRRKGDQATQDVPRGGGDVETGHDGVEAQGDGARGADGEAVGLGEGRRRHGRGLVGVGAVDGDVEGLVDDLPGDDAAGLEARLEHAGRDDQVGEDVGGHSEGEEDGLSII